MSWALTDPVTRAEKTVAAVEDCLRRGRFQDLGPLYDRLEQAIARLSGLPATDADGPRMADLRARVARTGTLLQAAMKGLRDAQALIRQPAGGFSSYDALGRTGQVGAPRTRFERRR